MPWMYCLVACGHVDMPTRSDAVQEVVGLPCTRAGGFLHT